MPSFHSFGEACFGCAVAPKAGTVCVFVHPETFLRRMHELWLAIANVPGFKADKPRPYLSISISIPLLIPTFFLGANTRLREFLLLVVQACKFWVHMRKGALPHLLLAGAINASQLSIPSTRRVYTERILSAFQLPQSVISLVLSMDDANEAVEREVIYHLDFGPSSGLEYCGYGGTGDDDEDYPIQ